METMKKDGASDEVIKKWILERKLIYPNGQQSQPLNQVNKNLSVNAAGTCADMGGESGWGVWQASTGNYYNGVITYNATGLTPSAPRFNLTSGAGIDGCTPGPTPGSPPIPVVAPGFGNTSIQMGERLTNGSQGGCSFGCVERLTYDLLVTPADTNFVYAYAIILEDPALGGTPHTKKQAPFAEIYALDQNGDTVECSHHKYLGDTTLNTIPPPPFFAAGCNNVNLTWDVAYKPWSVLGINLVKYIGQTIKFVIVNSDCGLGGHFCWSYWDFKCPPVSGSVTPFCLGQQTTIVGTPSDPSIAFTYTWYQNHHLYTGTPSSSSQTITPTPQVGDTFSVYIQQPSGCNYWMVYIPEPTTVIPDFHYVGHCGKMTFTDSSGVLPISNSNTVAAWNWQFPGGNPSTSTSQNPGTIVYPPGTYTVILAVTSSAGCTDTVKHSFTVGGSPTAAWNPTTPCLGTATTLTDASLPVSGDPINSWSWSMPGGNPATSTSQNTTTLYNTAGTHTVTLIVTPLHGCPDTITQQVLVYRPPIANFSGPDSGCAPVCNQYMDSSFAIDGNLVSWVWSFPGGNPNTATGQKPPLVCYNTPGSYGASLIITNSYGCVDTKIITPLVTVFAWPKADFGVAPLIQPATDPVFDFSDMWSNDVVQWNWNFGDNDLDSVSTDPVHSYSATANSNDYYNYNVCVRVENSHGCWDTICKTVELVPEFEFYIPNTFTPNGDFTNETFFGKCRGVKEYNIWVFDRWGNQLWDCHHNDKNTNWDSQGQDGLSSFCKWDGKVVGGGMDLNGHSNDLAQEDVYVWKVELKDIFDKHHTYIGHVNIVK